MCMSVSKNCINIDSYGCICVHCGCCEENNPNVNDRTERQIKYYKEQLERQYNFNEFDEDEKFAEIQRKNIASNIKYYKEKIEKLEHFLGMLEKAGGNNGEME